MTKPSIQAISSFWPIQLFYSLLAGLFFLPDFNPTLASTDGNQMGEGSLLAIDVAAGTNSLYLYIFIVTTCFFVLNKVIKRYELGRSQQFMEISTQIAWLGLFQVLTTLWLPETAIFLAFVPCVHLCLWIISKVNKDLNIALLEQALILCISAWLLISWVIPIHETFRLLLLLTLMISCALGINLIQRFKLNAAQLSGIAACSILPLLCTELHYFLLLHLQQHSSPYLLLILCLMLVLFVIFRLRKGNSTRNYAWILIVAGLGLPSFYQPYGTAPTEFFEMANRATPLMEAHFFRNIPLLEKASSHLVSDYGLGIIYQTLYGFQGLDFLVFDVFTHVIGLILSFLILKELTQKTLIAFYIVALFPFADASLAPYYSLALLPLLFLIKGLRKPKRFNAIAFGISVAILLPWRADLSFALLLSLIGISTLALYYRKISWKFFIPTLISCGILGSILLIVALANHIDWVNSLRLTLDYLTSTQSYGLSNRGDIHSNLFILQHILIPGISGILGLRILLTMRKQENPEWIKSAICLFLILFYLINLPRGTVRHGFAEGFDNFLLSWFPLILLAFVQGLSFKHRAYSWWYSLAILAVFQLFLRLPSRSPEHSLILKGFTSKLSAEVLPHQLPERRYAYDAAVLNSQMQPLVNYLRNSLKDGETFIDFGNMPMLYFYAEKEVPAFFYQSPQNVHSITLQRDWLKRLKDYEVPLFLFQHVPRAWWDETDGVPNELRHYLIAEFAYQHYFPAEQVHGYEVWKTKSSNDTLLPSFMESRIYSYFNLKKLPPIWHPELGIQIKDQTNASKESGTTWILPVPTQDACWLNLVIESHDQGGIARLTLLSENHPFGGFEFDISANSNHSYLIRPSILYSWWVMHPNSLRLELPVGAVLISHTFNQDVQPQ